jgi:integrative and conjugative element protein (TIGR02256 family)
MKVKFKSVGAIVVGPAALQALRGYRQRPRAAERGGVLAGYHSDRHWVITHVSPPSARSLGGLFWLRRDRRDAQRFINRVFAETNGAVNYLGEWHTHPETKPTPSACDRRMLSDLLASSRLEIDFLLGAIVGETGRLQWWCQTAAGDFEQAPSGAM